MSRKAITKNMRNDIKNKTNCKCGYCGAPLGERFHIDHILPFHNRGKCEKDNLLAACVSCNLQKGGMPLEHFRELIENKISQLNKIANFTIAKRYDLVIETPKKIVFFFEK